MKKNLETANLDTHSSSLQLRRLRLCASALVVRNEEVEAARLFVSASAPVGSRIACSKAPIMIHSVDVGGSAPALMAAVKDK